MTAFKLKRMLFNLYPQATIERVRSSVVVDHTSQAGGLYALEARVFNTLAMSRPYEIPWDLLSQLLLQLFVLALGISLGRSEFTYIRESAPDKLTPVVILIAAIFTSFAGIRLVRIWIIWRRRNTRFQELRRTQG